MRLSGPVSALLTPYDHRDRIDEGAVAALVDFELDRGVTGFLLGGTTGEGLLLALEERMQLADAVLRAVDRRTPVIVHVGATATRDAIRLARHAVDAGADAVASIPPIYYRGTASDVVTFYRGLAESVSIPVYAYHIPSTTGVFLYRDIVSGLATIPNVVGIKFSDTNLDELHYLKTEIRPQLNVVYGNDETLAAGLLMGADGGIGSTYNVMPGVYAAICGHAAAGRWEEARALQWRATRVINVLKRFGLLPALKAVLGRAGFAVGACRGPVEPLRGAPADLFEALHAAGYAALPGVALPGGR
jgi:N-acetylneuraminate lyase